MDKNGIIIKILNKYYNVEIELLDNIIRKGKVFKVPNCVKYVEGIIYIDGEIVPVLNIDLVSEEQILNRNYIIILVYKGEKIGIAAEEAFKLSDFEEINGKELETIDIVKVLVGLEAENG